MPRARISIVLLLWNGFISYLIIVLKLAISAQAEDGATPISSKLSLILAIMTIFIAATDV